MSLDTTIREFEPGTTGWTASDLDDPVIEAAWEPGAYEIVEGVLTKDAPTFLDSSVSLGVTIQNIMIMILFRFGASPDWLHGWYYRNKK